MMRELVNQSNYRLGACEIWPWCLRFFRQKLAKTVKKVENRLANHWVQDYSLASFFGTVLKCCRAVWQ